MVVKNQGPLYLDLTATAYHQNQDQVLFPAPTSPQRWWLLWRLTRFLMGTNPGRARLGS